MALIHSFSLSHHFDVMSYAVQVYILWFEFRLSGSCKKKCKAVPVLNWAPHLRRYGEQKYISHIFNLCICENKWSGLCSGLFTFRERTTWSEGRWVPEPVSEEKNPCPCQTTLLPSVSWLSRENVGASMSHNPMGFHSLLQG
jgi:hypothetical protein